MKQATINYDFIVVAVIAFIASCAYNVYQQIQFQDLFTRHVDLQWNNQNAEADLVYVRNQLTSCKNDSETGI
jgi:DNA-binding transcriptional regulator of glucitol operon